MKKNKKKLVLIMSYMAMFSFSVYSLNVHAESHKNKIKTVVYNGGYNKKILGNYYISNDKVKEIKNKNFLFNQLKELNLSDDQINGLINKFKSGEKKYDVLKSAKSISDENKNSENDLYKNTESLVNHANETKNRDDLNKAKESFDKIKYLNKNDLQSKINTIEADISNNEKIAKEKADKEAKEKADREAKEKADREAKEKASQNQQNNLSSNASESRSFGVNDGNAAFDQIVKDLNLSQSDINMWTFILNKESGLKVTATNPLSGAYGIPQALPGNKMASAGADWQTNPYTQLKWMYSYMQERYQGIGGAYNFWISNGWY